MAPLSLNDALFLLALLAFIGIVGPMLWWMTGARHGSKK